MVRQQWNAAVNIYSLMDLWRINISWNIIHFCRSEKVTRDKKQLDLWWKCETRLTALHESKEETWEINLNLYWWPQNDSQQSSERVWKAGKMLSLIATLVWKHCVCVGSDKKKSGRDNERQRESRKRTGAANTNISERSHLLLFTQDTQGHYVCDIWHRTKEKLF